MQSQQKVQTADIAVNFVTGVATNALFSSFLAQGIELKDNKATTIKVYALDAKFPLSRSTQSIYSKRV